MVLEQLLDEQVPVVVVVVDSVVAGLLQVEDDPLVLGRQGGDGDLRLRVLHPHLGLRLAEVRLVLARVCQWHPPLVVVRVVGVVVLDQQEPLLPRSAVQ